MSPYIDAILIGILCFMVSFTITQKKVQIDERPTPIWHGIPQEIQPFVDEYRILAANQGIFFTKPVTIGFNDLKDDTIGVCYQHINFREIDIDKKFWNYSTYTQKKSLLYHELTHCFCNRNHDYGYLKYYPDPDSSFSPFKFFAKKDGYMKDNCPLSAMNPVVLDDRCMSEHYEYYVKEMFSRCEPW